MTRKCYYCGEPALPGYRVCEGCKEAREIYPRIFEGDAPDKLETPVCEFEAMYNEACGNTEVEWLRQRCAELRAARDELVTENARLLQLIREIGAQLEQIPDHGIDAHNSRFVIGCVDMAYALVLEALQPSEEGEQS